MEKQVHEKSGLRGENGGSSKVETTCSKVERCGQNGLGKPKRCSPALQVRKKHRDVVSDPCRKIKQVMYECNKPAVKHSGEHNFVNGF